MTNAELRSLLAQYPDDMSVLVVCGRRCLPIVKVDHIVELETNEVSIEIVVQDKPNLTILTNWPDDEMWFTEP